MHYQEVTEGSSVLARLEYGADWGAELEAVARAADVESAWFFGAGAVEDAELAYYDQDEFAHVSVEYEEPLQVPIAMGTITRATSDKGAPEDGPSGTTDTAEEGRTSAADVEEGSSAEESAQLSARTRVVLSRPSGQALAGVLERATVFGGEVYLKAFAEPVSREPDAATDMDLLSL